MNRPEWFKCKECFWWDNEEQSDPDLGVCRHNARFQPTEEPVAYRQDTWCNDWTCARCWGSYCVLFAIDDETKEDVFVDHSGCNKLRFHKDWRNDDER